MWRNNTLIELWIRVNPNADPDTRSLTYQRKRFKLTGSGKLKRNKAGHSHMLIRRDRDVKRAAKKATVVAPSFEKRMKKMMGKI